MKRKRTRNHPKRQFLQDCCEQHVAGVTRIGGKWSKGHSGCSAQWVDGGFMFPGHQDGLESFIAGPYKPRSKTDLFSSWRGAKEQSPEAVNLETLNLKNINLLKLSISLNQRT